MIPLSVPNIGPAEQAAVAQALSSGWVSTAGPEIAAFEREMEAYTGARHAIALNSGTAALHLALLALETEPGDIVLVPNFTFAATLNAVAYVGARPLLVDIDPVTMQMDAGLVARYLELETEFRAGVCYERATGARIRALMPVHLLGYPCAIDQLLELAGSRGIALVEDAAASIGARSNGRHLGTLGLMGILSFNGNKVLTTGGGGMLLTHDPRLASHARHLAAQAKSFPTEYIHDAVGYNYGMTNLAAALGRAQLQRMPEFLAAKQAIHDRYKSAFAGTGLRHFSPDQSGASCNHWLEVVHGANIRELEAHLNENGIQARKLWLPMNRLPMHVDARYLSEHDHSFRAYEDSLCLPCSTGLASNDQQTVIDTVQAWMNR